MKRFVFVLLALVGFLLVWGVAEPYFIDEQTYEVGIPNLPASLEGKQVAVIADMQVGMWLGNTWTIERIVDRIINDKPAAVLIAGDFVYHVEGGSSLTVTKAVSLVAPLAEAGLPTYAVLGNHDYAMPTSQAPRDEALASAVQRALEDAGITVLQNQAAPLPTQTDEPPLYIVGVGAHVADEDRPELALAEVPDDAPRLALMHHPESFKAFPADTAPLAVAGHTHGGQFRIPFTPSWTWMSYTSEDEIHADGFIKNYGAAGNQLYVNQGIGFSVVPLRLNAPPELTLFTLRRGSGAETTR